MCIRDSHQISISFDNLINDVEGILLNYGEPFFDSSAIPSYYVSQAAKEHLTVILNGDGADELFGGYRRYVPFAKKDWFNSSATFKQLFAQVGGILPQPHQKKNLYNYLYRFISFAGKDGINSYLSATTDIFEGHTDKLITNPTSFKTLENLFTKVNDTNLSGLQKMLNLDFDSMLFSDLLVKMDIATMNHSLEGRSPFLSKELLETAPTIPDNLKIRGKTTKYLLRQLAKKYLPSALVNQPKRGFEIPLKSWVEQELKELIFDYLQPRDAYWRNFAQGKWVDQLMEGKVNISKEKRAKILWTLFSLELWYQRKVKEVPVMAKTV